MDIKSPFEGIKTYDKYWKLWALTAGLVLLHFPVVLLIIFVEKWLYLDFTAIEANIPMQVVIGLAALSVLSDLGVSWRAALADWRARFLPDAVKALKYFGGYLLVLGGVVAVALAAYLAFGETAVESSIQPMLSKGTEEGAMLRTAAASPLRMIFSVFGVCVVAPVVEELFFRRIFYTTVRARHGFWFSAFWSGLFFALAHGASAPALLPVGMYFCWVYERERRLPVNILLHSLINALMIAVRLNI
ncbi:MAG: CPBP family intramembrane glutamic endopeptidase [Elusimicrobiales bacterium]